MDPNKDKRLSDSFSEELSDDLTENEELCSSGGSEGIEKRQRTHSPSPSRQAAGSPFANLMVAGECKVSTLGSWAYMYM